MTVAQACNSEESKRRKQPAWVDLIWVHRAVTFLDREGNKIWGNTEQKLQGTLQVRSWLQTCTARQLCPVPIPHTTLPCWAVAFQLWSAPWGSLSTQGAPSVTAEPAHTNRAGEAVKEANISEPDLSDKYILRVQTRWHSSARSYQAY